MDPASEFTDDSSNDPNSQISTVEAIFDSITTFKCFCCRVSRAKYRCPGCSTPTCSLTCVRRHKSLLECDGVRSKVAFRRLETMSNLDVLSDYRLLEEIGRRRETVTKDRTRRFQKAKTPIKLTLKDNVLRQNGIRLRLLPPLMERAQRNLSYWEKNLNVAKWSLDWRFSHPSGIIETITTKPVSESTILKTILKRAISEIVNPSIKPAFNVASLNVVRVKLFHEPAGFEGENEDGGVFVEDEGVSGDNLKTTLSSRLRGRTFIEFPTFLVTLTPKESAETKEKEEIDEMDDNSEEEFCIKDEDDDGGMDGVGGTDGVGGDATDVVLIESEGLEKSIDHVDEKLDTCITSETDVHGVKDSYDDDVR